MIGRLVFPFATRYVIQREVMDINGKGGARLKQGIHISTTVGTLDLHVVVRCSETGALSFILENWPAASFAGPFAGCISTLGQGIDVQY